MVYTVCSIGYASYNIRTQEETFDPTTNQRAQPIIEPQETSAQPLQSTPLGKAVDEGVVDTFTPISADQIVEKTNDYRRSKKLAPLKNNELLARSACEKAKHMITENYWAHTSPDGKTPWHFIRQAGYDYRKSGENLAYGYRSSLSVVQGWIKSPGHEKILSGNYKETGICVIGNVFYRGHTTSLVVGHYGSQR